MEAEMKSAIESLDTRLKSLEERETKRATDEALQRIEDERRTLHARIGAVEDAIHRRAVAVEDVVHARADEIKSHIVAELTSVVNRVERALSGPRAVVLIAVIGFGFGVVAAPWIASIARATGL